MSNNNGANLGFEQKMWQAADKLRGNMDAAEYKHVKFTLPALEKNRNKKKIAEVKE